MTITLTNVEEAGTVTLSNNQPSASIEITATLTDPDDGVTGTSWQWAKSSDGANVWVDVGTDSPSYTPADGDVGHYLRATASYTDGHGSNKNAQATTAQAVEAGANRPPEFDATTATRTVAENTAAGEDIGAPVEATDPESDALTYTLGGTDAASFDIVDTSGQLQTKAPLDYETKDSYTVSVTATDPENASDTIDVTITVTNVEEAGTVTLSNNQPSASIEITADPDRPRRRRYRARHGSGRSPVTGPLVGSTSGPTPRPTRRLTGTWGITCGPRRPTPTGTVRTRTRRQQQPRRSRPGQTARRSSTSTETGSREVPENTAAGERHRRPGHGHRPGHWRHADLHPWRRRCRVIRHRRINRASCRPRLTWTTRPSPATR